MPEVQGGVPINGGRRTWDIVTARVGDDVGGGEGNTTWKPAGCSAQALGSLSSISRHPPAASAGRPWQWSSSSPEPVNRHPLPLGRGFQSCVGQLQPTDAGGEIVGVRAAGVHVRQELFHCARNPLMNSALSGICSHWLRSLQSPVGRDSQTGIGVWTRGWMRLNRPATAEP